ncbi:hypothetical protein ACQKCH_14700 [Nubsella zeaxanthinifaciens]|uniref:hypothetical protein n=1 Tax=Nubsella zeaxanthinifaciens TaxID=392412 RepID=UPI003CFCBC83
MEPNYSKIEQEENLNSLVLEVSDFQTVKPKITKANLGSGEGNGDQSTDGDNRVGI